MNYDIRLVTGSTFFPVPFTRPLPLVETVEPRFRMFQVNSEDIRTTLSTPFWFLIINFEQVLKIILLHLKRKFLLEIFKKTLITLKRFLGVQSGSFN